MKDTARAAAVRAPGAAGAGGFVASSVPSAAKRVQTSAPSPLGSKTGWTWIRVREGTSMTAMAIVPLMALPVRTSWPSLRKRTPLARPRSAGSLTLPALRRSQTKEACGAWPAVARARAGSQPTMFSQVRRRLTSTGCFVGLTAIHR